MKKILFFIAALLCLSVIVVAQEPEVAAETSKKSIDWMQVILGGGYLLGVFVLFPLVVYTNLKEKLYDPSSSADSLSPEEGLSEEDRNLKARAILEKIEEKLTPFTSDSGESMVTITKGSQAKFMKNGLDYINKHLMPTDEDVVARVNEFSEVYKDRTRRAYTGSNWVLACGIGVGGLMVATAGFDTFIIIHTIGLIFYYLSSRTTFYNLEKRMDRFGGKGGVAGKIMTALFLGNGVKYYVKQGSGPWKRDWETEGSMAMMGIVLLVIAALFLGLFAAALGVINSLINYSTNFVNPFKKEDKWYNDNFAMAA